MKLGFKGNRWSLPGVQACPTLTEGRRIFDALFGVQGNCHGMGRCDFYYAMMGGIIFTMLMDFGGETWINFSSELELTHFGQFI